MVGEAKWANREIMYEIYLAKKIYFESAQKFSLNFSKAKEK